MRASVVFLMMMLLAASEAGIANSATASTMAIVTKVEDTDDGRCDVDDCSLREAVESLTNGGVVTFADGVEGTINVEETINIANTIEIRGKLPRSDVVILHERFSRYMFRVQASGNLTLTLLTLTTDTDIIAAGGILVDSGTLRVDKSTFRDNQHSPIDNDRGTVIVSGSSFYGNRATLGGAISNNNGKVDIVNSTFFENHATAGGALGNVGSGVINIKYSTFSKNEAGLGATIYNLNRVTVSSSILEGNANAEDKRLNCTVTKIVDAGNNIQFPTSDCSPTLSTQNPRLFALADNGGATMTLALMDGSPAIDAGDPKVCAEHLGLVDQRGMPRSDGKCDIGAYEKQ